MYSVHFTSIADLIELIFVQPYCPVIVSFKISLCIHNISYNFSRTFLPDDK